MLSIARSLSDIRMRRCGTIIYTTIKSPISGDLELLFLLARHKTTRELGDLGGGIKKIESSLQGAFRELQEESRGIFSSVYKTYTDLDLCITLIDRDDMAEIFVPVGQEWIEDVYFKFIEAPLPKKVEEVSELLWVTKEEFEHLIWGEDDNFSQEILWSRIRRFLQKGLKYKEKFYKHLQNNSLRFAAKTKQSCHGQTIISA